MMLKRLSLTACTVLSLLIAAGCGKQSAPDTSADGKIKLYSLIAPVSWMAAQIGGDRVACSTLIPEMQSIHSYKPTPRDIAKLQSADYYLLIGLPMETNTLLKVLKDSKTRVIDITTEIKRRAIGAAEACDCEDDDHDHDHAHAHDHKDDHKHNEHEQFFDTHIWMSPANCAKMAEAICELLSVVDTANKKYYQANLKILLERINKVDAELKKQLAPMKGKKFLVYHPAFGYFAEHYGMTQVAVETGGKAPTPKQLEKLVSEARKENAKLIFVQPQFPQNSAKAISESLGAEIIMVNPLAADILTVYEGIADNLTKGK